MAGHQHRNYWKINFFFFFEILIINWKKERKEKKKKKGYNLMDLAWFIEKYVSKSSGATGRGPTAGPWEVE